MACTVFLLFMECLGWTFVAFMKRSRWSFFFGGGRGGGGVYSVCSAFGDRVAFTALAVFMGCWGGTLVAFTALVVLMRRSRWPFF